MTTPIISRQSGSSELPEAIFRHWIHSFEEDRGDVLVYRPEGYQFPVAHGRDGFEMMANGRFILEEIGPADGIVSTTGRWNYLGQRRVRVSFPGLVKAGFTFEVVDLDTRVLRIRKVGANIQVPAPEGEPTPINDHLAAPPSSAFRLINYTKAFVLTLESFPPQYVLHVTGVKPSTMSVRLMPLVYVQQPEYWEIEVVGALTGDGPFSKVPYTVSLPLSGPMGKHGIQVIGANRTDIFDIGEEPAPNEQ